MFENVKTLFFDFDGTIHNSVKIYAPAFKKAYSFLVEKGYAEYKVWKDEEVAYWLGFSSKDMWKQFMPNLDKKIAHEARTIIGNEMLRLLENGHGNLYDEALNTLRKLKEKGYILVFVSNCGYRYRDISNKVFHLDHYFDDFVCSQEYNYIPKYEIVHKILDSYPKEIVMIGDRFHDIEAGSRNNLKTIGCSYGYGDEEELKDADLIIHNIKELLNYL